MRAIRLGVVFDQHLRSGGGYQQALNAALLAKDLPAELAEVVFFSTLKGNLETLSCYGISARYLRISFITKVRAHLRHGFQNARLFKLFKLIEKVNPSEKPFLNEDIDLIYFLSPNRMARDLEKINYITTVWDLCHRDDLEFPEVRWDREFEARERNYRAILPRATAILVDSPFGKINTTRRYGIDEERVHVLPFQAAVEVCGYDAEGSMSVDISEKYQLAVPYVFYPAQFWAHKNHIYLLEGLNRLEMHHGLRVGAIFSGGDFGNLAYVKNYAASLGLEERIRFAGFVANEEVPELYRQSLALVMPTYFGPTNLPPLEAFELGVPVLCSDKDGLRDQVGEAALLIDLKDPGSMAQQLSKLVKEDGMRQHLIQKGKERLLELNETNRLNVLESIINDFRWRRLCWK